MFLVSLLVLYNEVSSFSCSEMDSMMNISMQSSSTTEAEYMKPTQAAKEAFWRQSPKPDSFLSSLGLSHVLRVMKMK